MSKLKILILTITVLALGIGAFLVFQKPALPEPLAQKQTLSQPNNQTQTPANQTNDDKIVITLKDKPVFAE